MTDILLSGCFVVIVFAIYTAIKVWWWNKPHDEKKKIKDTIGAIINSSTVNIIFAVLVILFFLLGALFIVDPIRYYGLQWHEYWFPKEIL